MKISLSWLKRYMTTSASVEELAETFTRIGFEVEDVDQPGKKLAPFTIAHVLSTAPHPNADRLKVAQVNLGHEVRTVVCGAPNCRADMKVVFADEGVLIPRDQFVLKRAKIRGVESQGMLCSASELLLGEESNGIIDLPSDAPIGQRYVDYVGLDDVVFDLNITPNRGNALGARQLAGELIAAGVAQAVAQSPAATLKPQGDFKLQLQPCDSPQFAVAVLKNVKNGDSPLWLQQLLKSVGLRPINALVDVTNFMMIDMNRPMHAFDAAKIKGGMTIRLAKAGEKLDLLNGQSVTLADNMTIIADDAQPLSLAGIMGGESSKVDATTTTVVLESAYFNPLAIAKTGRALNITSDSRYRFERGVDPMLVVEGLERAVALIKELCGGELVSCQIAGAASTTRRTIAYTPAAVLKRCGVDVPSKTQLAILQQLGFDVKADGDNWTIVVPPARNDMIEPADVVEEVMRLYGYHHIPSTPFAKTDDIAHALQSPQRTLAQQLAYLMASRGAHECVTWSFTSAAMAAHFTSQVDALLIHNPISVDLTTMRPSILPNLLLAVQRNRSRGLHHAQLFEVGPVFDRAEPNAQRTMLGVVRSGLEAPVHANQAERMVDVFTVKADVEAMMHHLHIRPDQYVFESGGGDHYHPGQSFRILHRGQVVVRAGAVHPAVLASCDLTKVAIVALEIDVAALLTLSHAAKRSPAALVMSDFPLVERDFAFIVSQSVSAAQLTQLAQSLSPLVQAVIIFDVFRGGNVPEGQQSVAVRLQLQATDRTLIEADIQALSEQLVAAVKNKLGGQLRT